MNYISGPVSAIMCKELSKKRSIVKRPFMRRKEEYMIRVGSGYDVHRLVEGRKLIIGGVDIPYEKGLI